MFDEELSNFSPDSLNSEASRKFTIQALGITIFRNMVILSGYLEIIILIFIKPFIMLFERQSEVSYPIKHE